MGNRTLSKDLSNTKQKNKIVLLLGIFTLIYIYIYNPPFSFLPFTPLRFLYILLLAFINPTFLLKFFQLFQKEILIFSLIIVYSLFRGIFGDNLDIFYVDLQTFVDTFLLGFIIVYFCLTSFPRINFLMLLLYISFVACIFTIILIIAPALNDYVRDQLLKTTEYTDLLKFRNFGLSEGLTFSYGIVQGITLAIIMYYINRKRIFLFILPLLVFSIMFNARIGFVPPLMMIVYMITFGKKATSIIFYSIISFFSMMFLLSLPIFESYQKTLEWGLDFFSEISNFFSGNVKKGSGNLDVLINNMIVLPDTSLEYIFGSGKNLFLDRYENTDIGYILQLNYGGLIYIGLLFSLVFYMLKKLINVNINYRWFNFLFITTIIICNIKGNFLTTSPALRYLFMIYIYIRISYSYYKNFLNTK